MKKKIILLSIIAFLSFSNNTTFAQFVIKVRPAFSMRPRPMQPARNHIWITPEYVWRNGNYVMADGYWCAPRKGYRYVPGNWRRKHRGFIWVPGRWKRF